VGGWPGHFFYGHEGIDLAWRLSDSGWKIVYAPQIEVYHPATKPSRHEVYYRMNVRNRVWLVRRNLPISLAVLHIGIWILITLFREQSLRNLRVWFLGLLEGFTSDCGVWKPLRWAIAWRMLRSGRPPII
jgi:GT2 family glycosyltransferase